MIRDGLEEFHRSERRSIYNKPDDVPIRLRIFYLPVCLLVDAIRLCTAITLPFAVFSRRAHFRSRLGLEHRTAMLDLYRVSWTLQAPSDAPALSVLNYLVTMTPANFDPTSVIDCFDTLIGCVKVTNGKVTVIRGSEQLAMVSALCCLHKLSFLVAMDTIVGVESVRQRYTRAFPSDANFDGLPFAHTLGAIHTVFYQTRKFRGDLPISMVQTTLFTWRAQLATRKHWWEDGGPSSDERVLVADVFTRCEAARQAWRVQWEGYKPSSDEHVIVSRALAKLARFEYRRRGHRKVPRWLLRFVFYSLSRHPLPPTSVIIDCLSIIALDLGCGSSNTTTPYDRCVHYTWRISAPLTNG